MVRSMFTILVLFAAFSVLGHSPEARAQEPGWYPRVIAPPEMRPIIQATPVELRPYRPLHFWGNTVRRTYYRGSPLPLPQDVLQTGTNLLTPATPILDRPIGRRFSR